MIATTTAVVVGVTAAVITGIGKYKMLEKMGEKGWKGFVPFLGEYVLYKRAWNTQMFWAALGTAFTAGVISQVGAHMAHPSLALGLTGLAIGAAGTFINLKFLHKVAKAFGHGIGCTLGMLVAEPIACLALGFGKSEYVGA